MDNDVVTRDPVDGGGDTVLVASLERVDNTENLSGVAASRCGVREDKADGLLRVNDEDGADGERNALGIDVGGILVVQHVVEVSDLAVLVADDGEAQLAAGNLIDVLDPAFVGLDRVGGQTDELDAPLCKLGLELGERTQLGGADRGKIIRVREKDDPVVANELMEVNWAVGGLGLEVGRNGPQAEGSWSFFCHFQVRAVLNK